MSSINVVSWDKKRIGEVDLPADVFEVEVREDILHSLVRWQQAGRRQGTHHTKTRSEVSGGGKKPFKQKGTGNARQGSSRSPLMPGGAILFGPKPRDYSYSLPKQFKRLGLRTALSFLKKENRIFVVDSMESQGKTNELAKRLKAFGLSRAVMVDDVEKPLVLRAAKNLPAFKYFSVDGLNVFDLLKYENVVLTAGSLTKVVSRCRAE